MVVWRSTNYQYKLMLFIGLYNKQKVTYPKIYPVYEEVLLLILSETTECPSLFPIHQLSENYC
jgi:hypothetical protein